MSHAKDNLPLAIAALLTMTFSLSLGDALVKGTSDLVSLWQVFVLRGLFALPAVVVIAFLVAKPLALVPRAPGWIVVRVGLLVLNWVAFYAALPFQPLALIAGVYYTSPIFMTVFSAMFSQEKIARAGWLAVFLGFIGVLVVIQPGTGTLGWSIILPLSAAIFYALANIVTRKHCRDEHPMTLAIGLNIGFVLTGAVGIAAIAWLSDGSGTSFVTRSYALVDGTILQAMMLLAVAIVIGSILTAVAYQNAPTSVIGPLDFSYIGFAVIWGWVFFSDFPTTVEMLGILLIVGGGLLSLRPARS